MSTANSTTTSNRIAAGVTTAYLRDLTRRPAPSPGDGRQATIRGHRLAAAGFGRARHDGRRRRPRRAAAV